MQSQAVLTSSSKDFSLMDKSEISKNLFAQIQWDDIIRSGAFLQPRDVSIDKVPSA
jgi:hypothetical protein